MGEDGFRILTAEEISGGWDSLFQQIADAGGDRSVRADIPLRELESLMATLDCQTTLAELAEAERERAWGLLRSLASDRCFQDGGPPCHGRWPDRPDRWHDTCSAFVLLAAEFLRGDGRLPQPPPTVRCIVFDTTAPRPSSPTVEPPERRR